ncbi:MAG: hypothetical protein RSF33_05490 [Hydrogenoanaerobacterium sp.]
MKKFEKSDITELHGNNAKIDPKKDVVSDYKFYAGIQHDVLNTVANIPIANDENIKEIKKFSEINKK